VCWAHATGHAVAGAADCNICGLVMRAARRYVLRASPVLACLRAACAGVHAVRTAREPDAGRMDAEPAPYVHPRAVRAGAAAAAAALMGALAAYAAWARVVAALIDVLLFVPRAVRRAAAARSTAEPGASSLAAAAAERSVFAGLTAPPAESPLPSRLSLALRRFAGIECGPWETAACAPVPADGGHGDDGCACALPAAAASDGGGAATVDLMRDLGRDYRRVPCVVSVTLFACSRPRAARRRVHCRAHNTHATAGRACGTGTCASSRESCSFCSRSSFRQRAQPLRAQFLAFCL
jgi:hypothetical protein